MRPLLMLLLALLVLASPAGATTLSITAGSVFGDSDLRDNLYRFSGPGFTVGGPLFGLGVQAGGFGVGSGGIIDGLMSVGFGFDTTVTVDGVGTCVASGSPPGCGFLLLRSTPVAFTADDLLSSRTIEGDVPFTASGHLNVGGGFDLEGQGTMHYRTEREIVTCGGEPCGSFRVWSASYGFAPAVVTEPSTLLLAGIGLSTAVIAARRKSRTARPIQ